MPKNLPLASSVGIGFLVTGVLSAVCVTGAASPISSVEGISTSIGEVPHDGRVRNSDGVAVPLRENDDEASSLALLAADVDERTETLLTYFGIEPRLVLPRRQAGAGTAGLEEPRVESSGVDSRTSVVPEPKEVWVLIVGVLLLIIGGVLRGWVSRDR